MPTTSIDQYQSLATALSKEMTKRKRVKKRIYWVTFECGRNGPLFIHNHENMLPGDETVQ